MVPDETGYNPAQTLGRLGLALLLPWYPLSRFVYLVLTLNGRIEGHRICCELLGWPCERPTEPRGKLSYPALFTTVALKQMKGENKKTGHNCKSWVQTLFSQHAFTSAPCAACEQSTPTPTSLRRSPPARIHHGIDCLHSLPVLAQPIGQLALLLRLLSSCRLQLAAAHGALHGRSSQQPHPCPQAAPKR